MEMRIFVEVSHPALNKLKQVAHFDELSNYRIIDYFGNNWGQNEFKGLVVTRVTNIDQALGMLQKGRADIAIFDSTLGRYKLKKLNLSDAIVELPNSLAIEGMHLCILKTSKYAQMIPKVDNYLQSGSYQKYVNTLLSDFIH